MKFSDLRSYTEDQLKDELAKLKKEAMNLRFQKTFGTLEKVSRIRIVRKAIAKINTLRNDKTSMFVKDSSPKNVKKLPSLANDETKNKKAKKLEKNVKEGDDA